MREQNEDWAYWTARFLNGSELAWERPPWILRHIGSQENAMLSPRHRDRGHVREQLVFRDSAGDGERPLARVGDQSRQFEHDMKDHIIRLPGL